ncbi:hypothetical protein TNCV_4840641 [Trichonephila clavipes]|nr:hypothetical protein TNCV_4840641 [Trichonephila clavipes]
MAQRLEISISETARLVNCSRRLSRLVKQKRRQTKARLIEQCRSKRKCFGTLSSMDTVRYGTAHRSYRKGGGRIMPSGDFLGAALGGSVSWGLSEHHYGSFATLGSLHTKRIPVSRNRSKSD